jgi:ribosomal protein S18 acetylase RimI-like enzyme
MSESSEYMIRDGFDLMDFVRINEMLAKSHWCPGIQKAETIQGAKNSALLLGAFTPDNVQISYARVISDKTRFAYILDVIVDERYRKQGIGRAMIRYILNHPDLMDVYQWLLVTKDAHGVYKKAGFRVISRPDDWMEIMKLRPVR